MSRRLHFLKNWTCLPWFLCLASAAAEPAPSYNQDVAPVFRAYCAGCHNDRDREGDFSLETLAALRKGGDKGDPVKPGDADGSHLIRQIEKKAKPAMPPADEPQVPAAELAMLKRWIAAGAPGPEKDESILRTLVVPNLPAAASTAPVTSVAISPDGSHSAAARGRRVEVRTGDAVVLQLPPLKGKVNSVHFSPHGNRLVVASGIPGLSGTATIFATATGAVLNELTGARDTLYDAELSPDGAWLATAGYDRVLRLWKMPEGTLTREIKGHNGAIFDLAWHPDSQVLATASADFTVKLWRASDGLRLDTLNQPLAEQTAVTFTPDGQHVISAGADKRIHLWKFISRDGPALNPLLEARFAHEAPVSALALSADGRLLVTSADDRVIKVWSVPGLVEQLAFPPRADITPALAFSPDASGFLAGGMDGTLTRLSLAPPAAPAHTTPPPAAAAATTGGTGLPITVEGAISRPGEAGLHRFSAKAGQTVFLEVNAARAKSSLDSRLEVLDAASNPVPQVVLQAVRDSWLTFRGKDAATSDDFRVQNWREMELDEYLYCNGEVVKLWIYPRGPDSGFRVYPGRGNRFTFFHTSPHAHPLGEPCYIVKPLPPGTPVVPNGLPVFHLNSENDDDPSLQAGRDSVLLFTAPATGDYQARVTDVRGFGGEKDFHYTLSIRLPQPGFTIALDGLGPKVSPGSGKEITVKATRREGFEGPIRVDVNGLPAGFTSSGPVTIEPGQNEALLVLNASPDAAAPDDAADKAVAVTATATINGAETTQPVGALGDIQLGPPAKVLVEILPEKDGQPAAFTIHPGETITARVRVQRKDFAGRIEFGTDDCGRNLPHGVYVDNIGLNGLLIVEGQSERTFTITASPVAAEGPRPFHLRTTADGTQASSAVILRVVK